VEKNKLKSIIESLLFTNGDTITISHLAKIISKEPKEVKEAIEELSQEYEKEDRGFRIVQKENTVQLVTNPNNSEHVQELVKNEIYSNLSRTALETLAIIAYREPVSRVDIDAIRGVNSNFILRNLLIRGLIERLDNPNDSRGYMYKLSIEFMKKVGINKIEELPDYEKLSKDEKIEAIVKNNPDKEESKK